MQKDSFFVRPPSPALAYAAAWLLCYCVYPVWHLPSGSSASFLLFNLFLVSGMALLIFSGRLEGGSSDRLNGKAPDMGVPGDKALWALILFSLACRFYFLTLPVQIGDELYHAAFPALPFKALGDVSRPALRLSAWTALGVSLYFRRRLLSAALNIRAWAERNRTAAAILLLSSGAAYFAAVETTINHFSAAGHPSLSTDLLRYPPLSRIIHLLVYLFFGANSFTAKLPQVVFSVLAAVFIYKLALKLSGITAARLSALLYLFLPPLVHQAVRVFQTHGELFLFLLASYLFLEWLDKKEPGLLLWSAAVIGIGFEYRYTLPVLGGAIAASRLTQKPVCPLDKRDVIAAGFLFVLPAPWLAINHFLALRPYAPEAGRTLLGGLKTALLTSLPDALGWPLAAVFAAGLFYGAYRSLKSRGHLFLMLYFLVYLVFISMDCPEFVRLLFPLLPPLILLTSELLAKLPARKAVYAAVVCYLVITGSVWTPSPLKSFVMAEALKYEYLPLDKAAGDIDNIPAGSVISTVNMERSLFSFYLMKPDRFRWHALDKEKAGLPGGLEKLLRENGSGFVCYMIGGGKYPDLDNAPAPAAQLESAPWAEEYSRRRFGANFIVLKRINWRVPSAQPDAPADF